MKPVIGFGMLGAGLILVYGGITGRLAPMIAALFTPSLLQGASSSGGSSKSGAASALDGILKATTAVETGGLSLLPGISGLVPKP